MRVINDKIENDTNIEEDTQLNGMIVGETIVAEGIQLDLNGMIVGNLIVGKSSTVHLFGTVVGDVVNNGGNLEVYGVVNGKIFRNAGNTSLDTRAVVRFGLH